MKERGWSSCGGGCGGGDEEDGGGQGFGEEKKEKDEVKNGLEMKRKSIYRF